MIDGEKKSAVELLREQIAVINTNDVDTDDNNSDEVSDDDDESEVDSEEIEKVEDQLDNKEDEIKTVEKTEEELDAERKAAKSQKEKDRIQRRMDKLTSEKKLAEAERDELRAKLEAKIADGDEVLTKEDVDKEARRIANETIAHNQFVEACNRIAEAAEKIDTDFNKKVNTMADDIGPIPSTMIAILDDLDNGGAVINELVNDVDEAERIYSLSPAKMALELAKISTKLSAPKKVVKEISKVPAPNSPLGAGSKAVKQLTDNMTDSEWIERRNADLSARRRA